MATPTGSCFLSCPVLLLLLLFCSGILQLLDAKSLPASELHANGGTREARNLFSFGLPPRGDHVHYYPEEHHHYYEDFGHGGYPGHHPEHYDPHYGQDFDHNRHYHHHHHYHQGFHNGHIDTHYF